MATSREVFNRIRWDPRFDPRRVVIGYRDHASDAPREAPFTAWDGTVPWHRVHYFALDGRVVWDRAGTDLLSAVLEEQAAAAVVSGGGFEPLAAHRFVGGDWVPVAAAGEPLPWPLRAITWNVLSERHDPEPARAPARRALAFEALRQRDADLVALQEVTRPFLAELLAQPWVRATCTVTDAPGDTLRPEGPLLLARRPFTATSHLFANGKRALVARFAGERRPLVVAVAHLTSDQARDAARKRAHELATLAAHLGGLRDEADVLLLGDFNTRQEDPGGLVARGGFRDAWRALRPADPGWTFVPSRNALAARTSWRGLPARFDRALLLAPDLAPRAVQRFGAAAEPASDHEGLALEVEAPRALDAPPDPRTALTVLPPARLRPMIDALRRDHDPAFGRWPPHLNLLFPFAPRDRVDEAAAVVAQAVAGVAPFSLSLAHLDVLEHASGATVVARPAEDAALQRLHAALAARFPRCPVRDEFVPHLSLARCAGRAQAVALAARFAVGWTAPLFDVRELCLLARDGDDPFSVARAVPLGASVDRWVDRDGAPRREAALRRVREALPGTQVHVTGSARLGLADAHSDLDLVVVAPGLTLARAADVLRAALGVPVRVADRARVPVARLALDDLPVDVHVAPAPPPDLERLDALRRTALERCGGGRFEAAAMALRAWARARRVLGQAWGFPGGLAWTRVAVDGLEGAAEDASTERLLLRALERAAGAWPRLVDELEAIAPMTRSTREVLEDELQRGVALARAGAWDELVLPPDPLHERDHALVLAAVGDDEEERERGRGVLEREGLGLLLALERADGVRAVRPHPPRRGEPAVVALDVADRGPVDALTEALAGALARGGGRLRAWLDERGGP